MKVYSKHIIRIPNDTDGKDLLTLKAFGDIYYVAYDTLPPENMRYITKVIMESIRKISNIEGSMSFARSANTDELALFVFDHKPDGIFRTVQRDDIGYYIEIE